MHKIQKDKQTEISPEKMAILAEQGLKAARLTKQEKRWLLGDGLKEIYNIWGFTGKQAPPLEPLTVDIIMKKFFPATLWVKIGEKIIDIVESPTGWIMGSPAFACRGRDTEGGGVHKRVGALTVHLNITSRDEGLTDIHVRLTDDSGKALTCFEVKLFKGERCVETVDTVKSATVSLYALESGDYKLCVSDAKGEITSIPLKIE